MNNKFHDFKRFVLIGLVSNAVNFSIYFFAYSLGSFFIASAAGYCAGLLVSYHFGRIWVFGEKFAVTQKNIIGFLVVYSIGGFGMAGLIELLGRSTNFDYRIIWLVGAVFAALNNYFGLKLFIFNGNKKMASKFGFLSKVEFLQDWASTLISGLNPALVHNLEKYHALKKVHYLSAIEDVDGDYLEFGVFTGSSFCHSIRCCLKVAKLNPNVLKTKFYGFDSFSGFGELEDKDKHPFYTDENFSTSAKSVGKRVGRVGGGKVNFQLVPGYFSESLKSGAYSLGIQKSKIIFIDSDTYSSAAEALDFCLPTVQLGTFIILDDYYSYRGSMNRGVARAFEEFVVGGKINVRQVLSYGMGGAVFVVSEKLQ